MQVEIFSPVDVYAAACDNGQCYISGLERGTANGFGLHFDDTEAMEEFGLAVVAEARRLLCARREVPANCGEAAP